LSQVDPDAIEYHAEGRLDEYVEKVDLEGALRQLSCPVLLVQGDQSHGGFISDEDVEQALALLSDGVYVRLDGKGHDLGLSTWEISPLLRAITIFLESL
jgi:pimeloyl-ACP methyl ester carboxylesterase